MSRKILAAVDDLFFASKIRATAQALGVELEFVCNIEQVSACAAEGKPDLIVVDLHSLKIDVMSLARMVKANVELTFVPLTGFFSHVDTGLQQAAIAAGYDCVVPRSVFARNLSNILRGVTKDI